jgi:1,4-dihydroxy-2-naphthoate octaprenyltransferase
MNNHRKLSPFQIWMLAARPKTLPAAVAPVIAGIGAASHDGVLQIIPGLAALVCAILLQIGANVANDAFDFYKGSDTKERLGPPRVTALGLLKPQHTVIGAIIIFAIAALIGLYLVFVGGLPILLIGIFSIIFAVAYSPLAYIGLGDLFAFAFFGPVAVIGTYYLQAGTISPLAVWVSIPIGFLVTAILVVNNLRDVEQDREHKKQTLAVRFGADFAKAEWGVLVVLSYAVPVVMLMTQAGSAWLLLTWVSLPIAYQVLEIVRHKIGRELNDGLGGTAQLTLVYALTLAIGLIVSQHFNF